MDEIELVVSTLSDALDVDVCTDVPPERPDRLVVVALDGYTPDEFLLKPRVALYCYGTSDADAARLALQATKTLQDAALTHPLLSSVEMDTKSGSIWTETGDSYYLAVLDLVINQ